MYPTKTTAVDGLREYQTNVEVFSSLVIGPGVKEGEETSLFIAPLGQRIPRLGEVPSDLFPAHVPLTTNLNIAGQLGYSLGDYAVKSMRLDFIGARLEDIQALIEAASFDLALSGKRVVEGGLRDLPKRFTDPLLLARHDTIKMNVKINQPFTVSAPFLLRAVLSGTMARDIR